MNEPARLIQSPDRAIPYEVERIIKQCRVDKLHGKVILDFKDGEILTGRIERSIHFK